MKGHISLESFIRQVKEELVAAQDTSGTPFYELETVQLEVTFALETTGGAKGKLVVLELGGEAKASQTHKVILTLKPLPKPKAVDSGGPGEVVTGGGGMGGGRGLLGGNKPVYGPIK
jgi:hypothetical protein